MLQNQFNCARRTLFNNLRESSPQSCPLVELEAAIPHNGLVNPESTESHLDQLFQPVETPTDPAMIPTPLDQGQTPEIRLMKQMSCAPRNLQTFNLA